MTPHRITIDMKKSGYKQFVNIRQAENESHIIYISLTNGTEPIKLDNDMVATVYLEGISKQWESCDIKDNEIVFTVPILNMGGTKCQIQLSNDNGYSISPTFIIVVENILNVPHFELLEEEPDDWIDNADSYYTFNGIDYVPVKYDNENRNILKDIKFSQTPVLVSVPSDQLYKQTPNISVTEGKKIYLTPTNGETTLSLFVSFYMWNDESEGPSMGQTKLYTETSSIITVPTIPKRDKNINNYNRVYMYCAVKSTDLDTELHANIQAEYDERTYLGCKTPYFEKGKYYAMVNDYGNVGNSYNALIQALQEARTYYNKAIKDVSMVDNCLVITYNDNTQYKSGDLKGDGIARLDKSTEGNVDTYTFVTDKGNTFSFTVTNADNTRIEDLYTQLGYKTPLTVFNNEVAYIKELINNLDTKKESIEEHNKSISQLQSSLSIINTQLSVLNNNKVEKDTYTTAIESLQSLVTKLQNSKVDTNTYNDEIANLTTAISELNDKQIDTNAIKESITELDTKKLNKEEYNQYKENVANTFATTDNNIKINKTSIESLSKDFNAYKTATDKAIADNTKSIKANATAIDKCVTDLGNVRNDIRKVANISANLYQFNDYGLYAESGADADNATEYYWHSMPIPVKIGDVLRTSKHASWLAAFLTMYDSNNNLISMRPGSLTNYYTNRDNDAYDEITIKTFEYNNITYIDKDFEGYIIISFSQGDFVKDPTKNVIVKNTDFPDNSVEYGKVTLNESIPLTAQQKKELLPIENKTMGVSSKFTKPFVCINFDDFSFDDDRFKIVHDEYGFPATVNITPNFNATNRDYTNYIKLLEAGWDVGLYGSTDWPKDTYGDDAFSDNPSAEVTSAWESYVSKTVEKAKLYGVYLPLTWLCRQMRTCVALETACKKHGIKYIRGNDMNNWTTSLYFKPAFKAVTQPSQLYPHTVDTVLENIDTAVKNGYGCTVFSHRLYDDEDTAKRNYGCTVANLRQVLDKIKELYDSEKIEVITFSDMYRKYFPDEMDNIEKRRNVLVALESKVSNNA